jgi:glycerol-3-phosphate dehydrogenase
MGPMARAPGQAGALAQAVQRARLGRHDWRLLIQRPGALPTRREDLMARLAEPPLRPGHHRRWRHRPGRGAGRRARGFSVVLVESHDFAKGTSSRATKLVHGGVRYLAQGNIALVREALARAHDAAAQRAAPGAAAAVRDAVLQAGGRRRFMASASRCTTRWPARPGWAPPNSWAATKRCAAAQRPAAGPEGRRQVLGRPVQRRAAGPGAGAHRGHPRRAAGQLLPGHGAGARGRQGGRADCEDAKPAAELPHPGALRGQCHRGLGGRFRQQDGEANRGDGRPTPMVAPSQGVHLVVDREFLPGDHA